MSERTQGGALLRRWLAEHRRSQDWLAEQIGTPQTTLSAWILGPRPPTLACAVAIRTITDIAVETWLVPSTEPETEEEESNGSET